MLLRFIGNMLNNNVFWSTADVYFYLLVLGLFLIAVYINRKEIWKKFKEAGKETLGLLGMVTGFGAIIRFLNINNSIRLAFSTWEYLLGARYFIERGLIHKCYGPSFFNCLAPSPVSHPAMYSLINGILYKFTGFSPTSTIYLAFFVSILTIPVSFLALYNYIDDKTASIIGSSIIGTIPLHIIFSVHLDGTLGVFSVLSAFSVLLATGFVIKNDDFKSWIFLFSSLLFAVGFRWENSLLILVVFLIFIMEKERPLKFLKKKLQDKRIFVVLVIFVILTISILKGVYTVWFLGQSLHSSFTFSYLLQSLSNLPSIFMNFYSVPVLFVACILPFALLKDHKKAIIGIFWLLSFGLLYSFFRNGLTARYLMNTLPPIALLGSLGYKGLSEFFDKINISRHLQRIISIIVIIFLISTTIFTVGFNREKEEGNIHKLIEFSNYVGEKPIVVPDINTLLALLCYSDEKRVGSFLTLPQLIRRYGENEFYFLRTHRCEISNFKEICDYLSDIGDLEKEKYGWKLYYLKLNKKQQSRLRQLVESHDL